MLIECVDVCIGLARKKVRKETSIASRHGTLLFSDQNGVDNFVNYQLKGAKSVVQVTVTVFICYLLQVCGTVSVHYWCLA